MLYLFSVLSKYWRHATLLKPLLPPTACIRNLYPMIPIMSATYCFCPASRICQ